MFLPKVAFTLFALAGLGTNLYASAFQAADGDFALGARSFEEDYGLALDARDLDDGSAYGGYLALRSAEPEEDDILSFLAVRDAKKHKKHKKHHKHKAHKKHKKHHKHKAHKKHKKHHKHKKHQEKPKKEEHHEKHEEHKKPKQHKNDEDNDKDDLDFDV